MPLSLLRFLKTRPFLSLALGLCLLPFFSSNWLLNGILPQLILISLAIGLILLKTGHLLQQGWRACFKSTKNPDPAHTPTQKPGWLETTLFLLLTLGLCLITQHATQALIQQGPQLIELAYLAAHNSSGQPDPQANPGSPQALPNLQTLQTQLAQHGINSRPLTPNSLHVTSGPISIEIRHSINAQGCQNIRSTPFWGGRIEATLCPQTED